jgi:hypothetical protein
MQVKYKSGLDLSLIRREMKVFLLLSLVGVANALFQLPIGSINRGEELLREGEIKDYKNIGSRQVGRVPITATTQSLSF